MTKDEKLSMDTAVEIERAVNEKDGTICKAIKDASEIIKYGNSKDNTEKKTVANRLTEYADYASRISEKRVQRIKSAYDAVCKEFSITDSDPFAIYISIDYAKKYNDNPDVQVLFDLRYLGQNIGLIKKPQKGVASIVLVLKKGEKGSIYYNETNFRDFYNGKREAKELLQNPMELKAGSPEAKAFLDYFRDNRPERNNNEEISDTDKHKNEEHRVESLLLTKYHKEGESAAIHPVTLGDARFAMTTVFSASNHKKIKGVAKGPGGGIDILGYTMDGQVKVLTVIEVKDENKPEEPSSAALQQAAVYAVFLQNLIRHQKKDEAQRWWEIYGMDGEIPDKLVIRIACAMPKNANSSEFCRQLKADKIQIPFDRSKPNGDCVELHTIFFDDCGTELKNFISTFD